MKLLPLLILVFFLTACTQPQTANNSSSTIPVASPAPVATADPERANADREIEQAVREYVKAKASQKAVVGVSIQRRQRNLYFVTADFGNYDEDFFVVQQFQTAGRLYWRATGADLELLRMLGLVEDTPSRPSN